MGLKDTKADGDVYRRKAFRGDNTPYYEYMVVYVDDIICISENPDHWINILATQNRLQEIGIPKHFLGSDIKSTDYLNDDGLLATCWVFGSESYAKDACQLADNQMKKH